MARVKDEPEVEKPYLGLKGRVSEGHRDFLRFGELALEKADSHVKDGDFNDIREQKVQSNTSAAWAPTAVRLQERASLTGVLPSGKQGGRLAWASAHSSGSH